MTETGLVVDGVHGIYVGGFVVDIARRLGWEGPEWDLGDDPEWRIYTEDAATEWLNEYHAEDGHAYGWHEGDFFYLSDDEWEVMV